jgi:hypothetical protein
VSFGWRPKSDASPLSALAAFAGVGADQVTPELGEAD